MFGNRRAGASAKRFCPPEEFEYNWLLALRLMACESRGGFSCVIEAESPRVTLRINGLENLGGMARTYAPGAYQYFFQHPTYNGGSLRLTFQEPDCYIFGCPPEGMEYDLRELAPNAYISSWNENGGNKRIYIRFDSFDSDQETERWDTFMKYYNIWLQ